MNKRKIRDEYKLVRKKIENKDLKSYTISNKIIQNRLYKDAKTIAIYKSMDDEVNTEHIIKIALNEGKTVVVPRVTENSSMNFYKISLNEKFEISKFGIREPFENKNNLISKKDIDLIIVPGVCFDKSNNRLGYGGGYYDRYLTNCNAKKIGICFREQILEKIDDIEKTDVKMDLIITN